MSTHRLVFGDDGSAAADVAWLWVNGHRWPDWTISVVTARRPAEWTPLPPERTEPHPWDPPRPRELLAGADQTRVEHLVAEADPRVVLESFQDADLLVLGPRGRGVLKQLHVGSTAEWLLGKPRTPVAIVRNGRPTRRVVLCADVSPNVERAAASLAGLPWIGDCEVTVLTVADGRTDVDAAIDAAARPLRVAGIEPAERRLDAPRHGPTGRRDPRPVLLEALRELDADLAALGTAGPGGLRRALTGSTSRAVALHADCSVLVAHAGD